MIVFPFTSVFFRVFSVLYYSCIYSLLLFIVCNSLFILLLLCSVSLVDSLLFPSPPFSVLLFCFTFVYALLVLLLVCVYLVRFLCCVSVFFFTESCDLLDLHSCLPRRSFVHAFSIASEYLRILSAVFYLLLPLGLHP